jgi:hypothetical protein
MARQLEEVEAGAGEGYRCDHRERAVGGCGLFAWQAWAWRTEAWQCERCAGASYEWPVKACA